MVRKVLLLGKEYDLDDYGTAELNEWARGYAEPVVTALEKWGRRGKDIPHKESWELWPLHKSFIETITEEICRELAPALSALYLPRLTRLLPGVTTRLRDARTLEQLGSVINTTRPLLTLLHVIYLAFSSRIVQCYFRSPFIAAPWAEFLARYTIYEIRHITHKEKLLWISSGILSHVLILGKPVPRSQGGDGRSCLNPLVRQELDIELEEKTRFDSDTWDLLEIVRNSLRGIDDGGRSFVRQRYQDKREEMFTCVHCGDIGEATCGGCRNAQYCSRGCQRADWEGGHRHKCFAIDYSALQR